MNRIDEFAKQGKKAFVPYITAGHPSKAASLDIMHLLVECGADIIELGLPFSDPTADGPTIQSSSHYALKQGFQLDDYFELIQQFRQTNTETPIVAFTYYNPVFCRTPDVFAEKLAAAGADAMLVVDVPFEEQDELIPALESNGLHLIQLIAPTTPDDRIKQIVGRAAGFVYQIALKGVTGARDSIADDALDNARRTRSFTDIPVYMGFGVSNGQMAGAVSSAADGVVVGSALVKCIHENRDNYGTPLRALATELAQATHAGR